MNLNNTGSSPSVTVSASVTTSKEPYAASIDACSYIKYVLS